MRNPKILVLDRAASLADQVRGVVGEMRPRPEVVHCERVGAVGELLADDGPFDVMLAGPSLGTKAGLSRIQVIHEELPAMSILLGFSSRPEAKLRDIVRTGADDLLPLPLQDEALLDAVERALDMSRKHTHPVGVEAAAGKPALGTVFTICSATGGCGKTFYATNLAYLLCHYTGKRVCIVDLDLQFGEVSTALRLRPRFTIFDVLQRDDDEEGDFVDHIEEYIVKHDSGIHLLAAPKAPHEADRVTPPDVTRIIEALRTKFDYVIVDTPPTLSETVLAAFDLSTHLFALATLDLPSVRNLAVFLNTLEKLKIPQDNIRLVLNKAESEVGIEVSQVTKMFPQGFSSVLPYAREVSKSINLGVPVLGFSPRSEVSRRLAAGLKWVLPEEAQARIDDVEQPAGRSLFSRLFRQSSPQLSHS